MDLFLRLGGPISFGNLDSLLCLRRDLHLCLFFRIRLFARDLLDLAFRLSHLYHIDQPSQPSRSSLDLADHLDHLDPLDPFPLSRPFPLCQPYRDGTNPPYVPCAPSPVVPSCPCYPYAYAIFYASSPRTWTLTFFSSRFGSDYGSVYLVTRQMKYIENFVNLKQNDVVMYLTYLLYAFSSSFAHCHDAKNPPFDSPSTAPNSTHDYLSLI